MKYFKQCQLASLIIALCSYNTYAEEVSDKNTEEEIEKITITGAGIFPSSKGIATDILESLSVGTSDTASLFRSIPGVNIQSSGGVSSFPVIHGFSDDRIRIKVDGMDLISACGNHMNPPLSYIDPTSVDSATIFAGITPVSLGGDSIGSTIVVNSIEPTFSDNDELLTSAEVGTSYRSNGNVLSSNVSASLAGKVFSFNYTGSTTKAENYTAGGDFKEAGLAAAGRSRLEGDEVGSSMYKSTNHALAFALKLDNHLIDLKLGIQDIPYQGWPNQRMDMTANDSVQLNLHYEGQYDWGVLEGRLYNEKTEHAMQFGDDKLYWYGSKPNFDGIACTPTGGKMGCAAGMPMDTEGNNTGLVVNANFMLSEFETLRVGIETQEYTLDDYWNPSGKGMWPSTFVNINNGERNRIALYAEWENKVNKQWALQFGARYENVEMNTGKVQGYNSMMADYKGESAAFNSADRNKTDDNIDLTALARYQTNDTDAIEFGFARKSRSPNLYERFAWSTGGMAMRMINMVGDGNGYVGNLALEPEVAHTVSANFDWKSHEKNKWDITMSPYFTYVDDYIDVNRCVSKNMNCGPMNQMATDAYVYLQFDNQSAHIYGFDLSGKALINQSDEYGTFTTTAIINYVRGENNTTNDNLFNIMPWNAKFALNHEKNNWTSTLELELVDAKTDVSAVRNEIETSGFGIMHFRSNYKWKSIQVDFGISNILDKLYNHPLSGAYTGQGKTMSGTGVPWGVSVPGMGRSIYTGISFKF